VIDMNEDILEVKEGYEYVKCNLCGSNDSTILFTGKDRLYKNPGSFSVVKCRKCGLIYTNPRPSEKQISLYYPPEYWGFKAKKKNFAIIAFYLKIVHALINAICYRMSIPFKTDGKILDIGCGNGKFLYSMWKLGWLAYGVEISDLAAKYAREELGLNIFTGTVEEASFSNEFFDGITMHQVLEHVADPTATLLEINRILKDDGLLAISVPDADSLEARIFKKYRINWDIPRHFYHFSPENLKRLLEKTGFEVIKIKHDPHPGGILGSIQHIFEDIKIEPRISFAVTYTLAFPLAYLIGFILGKLNSSGSMAVYARKKLRNNQKYYV